jgi:hypothetical protein
MKKDKSKKTTPELNNAEVPSWFKDNLPGRSTPYSEEELDLLVEGTIEGLGIQPRGRILYSELVRKKPDVSYALT